jgi:glycosyltransferase involved in cell wall biosynthesis
MMWQRLPLQEFHESSRRQYAVAPSRKWRYQFALPHGLEKAGRVKISVVIPAYNAASFLPRCLNSVFAQTLKPHEIIVVDDGSSDASASIARELGATVVQRPNGGLSAARNTGIQNASGDWIALLDADDMWTSDKLERQAQRISADTVLVYTGIRVFDDAGVREEREAFTPARAAEMLRYCNPITPSTTLVSRRAVMQDGGFREDIRACEDWEMWVRLLRLGAFQAVPEPLTYYYVHPHSLSANPEKMLQAFDRILDSTLISDLRGLNRWLWRRRIWAKQLFSAALIAEENQLPGAVNYLVRSLWAWPSPARDAKRYIHLAGHIRNVFLNGRKAETET